MSTITDLTVEDRVAIQELLARYCRFFDAGFVDAFVACFASDCTIVEERMEDEVYWHGHDGVRRLLAHYHGTPSLAGRRHHVGRVVMEREGQSVAVKSFSLVTECHGEPPNQLQFAGFYLDDVVKRETRWVFKTRVIRRWDTEALKPIPGRWRWAPEPGRAGRQAGTR